MKINATRIPTAIPRKYNAVITIPPLPGKNALTKNAYIGSFAVQLINGVSKIVILRSLSLGSVLVDITAGTVHPNPIKSGTMLRPESPILRSSLSIKNATLAIYPLSSISDRKKNNVTMIGRNDSTEPTPANIPSITRLCNAEFTPAALSPLSTATVRASIPISRSFCRPAPITLNVNINTAAIIAMKHGIAVYLPVRIRSIFSLRSLSLLSLGLTTVFSHTFSMNENRISAIAALLSSPRSFSIWMTTCSSVSISFLSRFNFSRIRLSPSISFDAAKRTGIPAVTA